ncbi:MAG: ATP-binding protein [Dehalococcoidia bacterium]
MISSEDTRPVGLVLGTRAEAATPLEFWVYVDEDSYLQLDDVVHVRSALPGGRPVEAIDLYGVVDEVRALQEGVSFDSDVALASRGVLPAQNAVAAHVAVTRIEPEVFVPPMPGTEVSRAQGAARDAALFFDEMKLKDGTDTRVAFGLSRAGEPVFGNLQFLNGVRGGHVNISGISGVATKTSYAMFLLYSLFEGSALGALRANTRALVFNVKGEDLLFLDQPNADLDEASREDYGRLELPARPFESSAFFVPVGKGQKPIPDAGSRMDGVTGFYWTLHEFCEERYLRFLFADADSEESLRSYLVDIVEARLAECALDTRRAGTMDGRVLVGGETIDTFDALVDAIEKHITPDEYEDSLAWAGRGGSAAALGTVRAFMRRLRGAIPHVGHLIRGRASEDNAAHRIDWQAQQLTVIGINNLHDRAQRFVVGVVLKRLMALREQQGVNSESARVFVVLDELNKYAPREGHSPIKDVLLDIAERGRSLGVILIGAQQTASEVESRVVANCSYRIVGRLDSAEAQRGEYGFLTPAARARASLLKPGTMIVHQPEIPVPLLVRFPFPAWATRASEVARASDPFARFELGRV